MAIAARGTKANRLCRLHSSFIEPVAQPFNHRHDPDLARGAKDHAQLHSAFNPQAPGFVGVDGPGLLQNLNSFERRGHYLSDSGLRGRRFGLVKSSIR